ncbi:MAG TPA: GyrI-like domain-containing protein [Steroidobacteraceae bacterium]|jgi:AraC family transcriptional regulator|nr:GyrI-like domain-containing protein [Steroidobacteraceae bacterium]
MRRQPGTEYARRMHAVLEHIDRHLDRDIRLEELASVAHFSPFHFHRVFSAWSGEVLGEYLRRRRIEVAAVRLRAQPELSVLRVALSVGFSSSEAFTRAFRARFALTPTQWRKRKTGLFDSKADQARRAASSHHASLSQVGMEISMKVKLVDRDPVEVAYLRHTGPYGASLARFWQESVYPWMSANNLLGNTRYGVSLDDPSVTKPEKCRYDACVEVPKSTTLMGKPMRRVLPGGRYAVLQFHGTASEIEVAWDQLLRDWLPTSGLQLDSRPFFEHYPPQAGFDPGTGRFECEICVPVAPL